MRKWIFLLPAAGLLAFGLQAAAFAQDGWRFLADTGAGGWFGTTAYDLRLVTPATGEGVASRLVFPLGTLGTGIRLQAAESREDRLRWILRAGLETNLLGTSGRMKDYDWYTQVGYADLPFSYTESQVRMGSLLASIQADRLLADWGPLDVYASFGYRYQHIHQEIVGYTGWQIAYDTPSGTSPAAAGAAVGYQVVPVSGSEQALTYRIDYHIPSAGLAARLAPLPRLGLALSAAFLLPYARDVDDHLLRNTLSVGRGIGYGYRLGAELRFRLSGPPDRRSTYLVIDGGLTGLLIPGTQTQSWYGDDPTTPENDTGTTFTGLPHRISSTQGTLRLSLGFGF